MMRRLLGIGLCLLIVVACHSREKTMYGWIDTMTACPKPDENLYPKTDSKAEAFFKQAIAAEVAEPKQLKQEAIVDLYRQAAELGYWPAMRNLAISYYQGDGVAENPAKALYWFQQVEKLGIPEGYKDMALVYRKGIGVEIDNAKSQEYMVKAAQAGDADAQFYIGHDLFGPSDTVAGQRAVKLWQCAAEQGHKDAYHFLAIHYQINNDMTKAYRTYVQGAKAGSSHCITTLAEAYEQINPKHPTFNLKKDWPKADCLRKLDEKLDVDPNLTFPDLDTLCPGTVPQPNEMK